MTGTQQWRDHRHSLHLAVGAQFLAVVLAYRLLAMRIDLASIVLMGLPILTCAAIACCYQRRQDAAGLAIGAEAMALLLCLLLFGQLLTYVAGTSGYPYVDPALHAADLALGFDWRAYAAWADRMPWLCLVLAQAYHSFNIQPVLLVLVLVMVGQIRRLQIVSLALVATISVTSLIFVFAPAVSAFAYLHVTAAEFPHIHAANGDDHIPILAGLRDGSLRTVSAQQLTGLITFPSFHACAAMLFGWGFWAVKPLRWPAVAVNFLMLASTPLFGAHYAVDLIGGIALAIAALAIIAPAFPNQGIATFPALFPALPKRTFSIR